MRDFFGKFLAVLVWPFISVAILTVVAFALLIAWFAIPLQDNEEKG